jgi:outer membrane protein assembly factor BamE (lipoprotein component of BamABCDE complex)
MRFATLFLAVVSISLAASAAGTGEGWRQLRLGLTRPQVAEKVGPPLLVSAARGSEIWTYDRGGAVYFERGVVIDFQKPAASDK